MRVITSYSIHYTKLYDHLLLIGDGDRGLSVDSLEGTVTLEKEDVRWRGAAGQRPWYAGIIVEKLTVLLDVNGSYNFV